MIDRKHDLSITKQAEILKVSRGSVYYLPRPVSSADLEIMRTHPASTPGRRDLPLRIAQAATAALDCWFAFQFQGSRSATLLAG
jgi:hypothetical protein